jgi:hypothetical protein
MLEKDLLFKLTPENIGQLYSKYYLIDISQVEVEIYLEFETHLDPLCKLKDLLNITLFAKQIFDISQTEGELLYIWIIIHHRWFVHKEITNHHSYERKHANERIKDFVPDHWFNRHPHRGYFRGGMNNTVVKSKEELHGIMDEIMELSKEEKLYVEYFWIYDWDTARKKKNFSNMKGVWMNTDHREFYCNCKEANTLKPIGFIHRKRILIRRPIGNDGDPNSPEIVG